MRISNIVRGIENVVIDRAIRTTRAAKVFAHETSIEVRARQLAREQRIAVAMADKMRTMSTAELAQLEAERVEIERRAAALVNPRKKATKKPAKRTKR